MFKLFPSLANSSVLGTRLLFVHVVDASLSGLPTLIELQNMLRGSRQIVGNLLQCGNSELNTFRILASLISDAPPVPGSEYFRYMIHFASDCVNMAN